MNTGGVGTRAWLARGAIVLAVAASAAGLGLAVAGVHSAARTALVLLFLAAGPTAAIAGLLRGFPPFSRVIIAFTADLMLIAVIAIIMLSAGLWSPTGGLLAVAVVTAACLAVQLPPARRVLVGWAGKLMLAGKQAWAGAQAAARRQTPAAQRRTPG